MHDAELVVQEAQRWLRFAAEDLEAARRLLAVRSSAPRHVCWHSQQAVGKGVEGRPWCSRGSISPSPMT